MGCFTAENFQDGNQIGVKIIMEDIIELFFIPIPTKKYVTGFNNTNGWTNKGWIFLGKLHRIRIIINDLDSYVIVSIINIIMIINSRIFIKNKWLITIKRISNNTGYKSNISDYDKRYNNAKYS